MRKSIHAKVTSNADNCSLLKYSLLFSCLAWDLTKIKILTELIANHCIDRLKTVGFLLEFGIVKSNLKGRCVSVTFIEENTDRKLSK